MILVTNNKSFLERKDYLKSNGFRLVLFEEKDYIEILEYSRNLIHKGYELLTHPLYGSIKPNETIYRSIVLKENTVVDFNSVTLIEDAISTAIKFAKNKQRPIWTEKIKDDFRVIDMDLISKTVDRIIV